MKGGVAAILAAVRALGAAGDLERLDGELLVVARPVRGGRRAGDAGRDPGRRDRRPRDHHRAVEPRRRRRPCRRDHVPADRSGPGGPRVAAARGRLGARQPVRRSAAALEADETAPQRGRDRPADDRARAAVPDDHRHRRGRGVGLDRARPGHRRRPLRRPARPVGGGRRGGAAGGIAAACAADPFLRDHPATVEITGGRFGSARVPSDHPLPVGLADVGRGRHRAAARRSSASRTAPTCRCSSTSARRRASSSARATSGSRTAPTSTCRSTRSRLRPGARRVGPPGAARAGLSARQPAPAARLDRAPRG